MDGGSKKEALGAKLLPPRVKAIRRERLEERLSALWERRLGVVVGPAGSGKTTLLAQFTASCPSPVAWYRADGHDASATSLLRHLERTLAAGLEGLEIGWRDTDDAVEAMAQWSGSGALLVVDDVHLFAGTPAEACLARLVDDAPPSFRFLVAGRRPPGFNLPRLRVSGQSLEIGADDLRFRAWEVERMFRDLYEETLCPEDLAALARRTEGWAAGLQLFHLATARKSPGERRRFLRQLAASSRFVREYLARNVLDELPANIKEFMLATSVLGTLTGPLCDRLLGSSGSGMILAELERNQIFTASIGDSGGYRYHEVLRAELEMLLVERLGEEGARERYRAAGRLLEEDGALPDALRAYARADDAGALALLLDARGEEVAEGSAALVEGLPPAVVANDPWLQLAAARRAVAAGQWRAALDRYDAAEALFGPRAAIVACHEERLALGAWLHPNAVVPTVDWSGAVRLATRADPLAGRRQTERIGGTLGRLASGVAELLAGRVRDARASFDAVLAAEDAGPVAVIGARLAACVARLLSGEAVVAGDLEDLAVDAEEIGFPWFARLARGLIAFTHHGRTGEAARFREYCAASDDTWGMALGAMIEGFADLGRGTAAISALEDAARAFDQIDAGVLKCWATSALALAQVRDNHPGARDTALRAESLARSVAVPGAVALACLALADRDSGQGYFGVQAAMIADECGLHLDAFRVPRLPERPASPAPVVVKCLGTFAISVGGEPVDCAAVKPRARACLRLLALHAGRAVHKETLIECLWPDVSARAGLRNLHVVISTLRQLLEPGVARGGSSLITRDADSYRLSLPPGSASDVVSFRDAMADAHTARLAGDRTGETAAYRRVLGLYSGELLPDAGPAEWVVVERERYRMDAADAAQGLAEAELAAGDPAAAAETCERGLRIDRHRDQLWRMRIEAGRRAGDLAGSASVRLAYDSVLAELGLPPAAEVRDRLSC